MKRRKPDLSAEDRALWDKVAETVTPLGGRPDTPPPPKVRRFHADNMSAALPAEWHIRQSPAPEPRIDRKTRRRIAAGHMPVDRSVDLHGLTQDQAHALLRRTVEGCVRRGDKALLVVTGKGGKRFSQMDDVPAAYRTRESFGQFGGVLKRMVPLWLEGPDLKPFIQSYGPAADGHGGEGALYVLLRKRIPGSRKP